MRPRSSLQPDDRSLQPDDNSLQPDNNSLRPYISYLKDYFRIVSLKSLWFTILFTGVLVSLNYTVGIEKRMRALHPLPLSLLAFFLFYGFVFFGAWGIQYSYERRGGDRRRGERTQDVFTAATPIPGSRNRRRFLFSLLLAPLYFAFKMIHWDLSFLIPSAWHYPWDKYTLTLLQLPAKLVLLLLMLMTCRKAGAWPDQTVSDAASPPGGWASLGLTKKGFSLLPYLLLLLCLAPLVALASTQHDFLHAYPKFKSIAFINGYANPVWPWRLLYELSYGLDFVSIELFFRGFLIIGLARWAGSGTILPMAAFYCTIHFGKPLGECISSFAGGLTLGVIAWRTRSILGGLMVHLGLAWMMEIGGWIGGVYQ